MEQLTRVMMQLIKSEICNIPSQESAQDALSDVICDEFLEKLYQLSKAHDLAHIVGNALEKRGLLSESPISQKFRKQTFTAVYRYQQLQYTYSRICAVLEEAKIPYLPLKGSVIRAYYPEPWMRTSCDIDVLVHEEDLERAVQALCQALSFKAEEEKGYHDVSLFSPNGIHLELHFSILEGMESIDTVLSHVWEYSSAAREGVYEYKQSYSYLIFHTVAHMSYHFVHGGCGVRAFTDLYLLKNTPSYNANDVRLLSAACGMEAFLEGVLSLSDVWFGEAEHTNLTKDMEDYLLRGGVYGSKENVIAAAQEKKGGKFKYLLYRIFMPYEKLKLQYPSLEGKRWLTPVYQIRRWFRMLFGGRFGTSIAELKTAQAMDKDRSKTTVELLSKLGL